MTDDVARPGPRPLAECRSIAELFLARARSTPETLAYQYPRKDGVYARMSWREALDRVRAISLGLRALGLKAEEPCAILAGTRLEWILVDLAILCAAGATTTIYPASPAADCEHILTDSRSVVCFVENPEQLEKLLSVRSALGDLKRVVLLDGEPPPAADGWVMTLSALEEQGRAYDREHPAEFERVATSIEPRQLATLMYTSGTTGRPKGVRLCHDGWLYQGEVGTSVGLLSPEDHQYLWLPLAHAMGKVLEVCAIRVGFPTTVDGRVALLMENLGKVQPTFMGAPPRIFEKLYQAVVAGARQKGGAALAVFEWACRVGRAVSEQKRRGRAPRGLLALKYAIADKLVFSKVRARFGGRIRFMFSGSAALASELAEFFHAAGLLVLEGYGLTESSAGAILNRFDAFQFGSVGRPLPGTELKLDPDGEILLRSRGVMLGYHNLPAETAAVLDADGWLRTGDIGSVDAEGFLRITDRKKDLIKTSSGLYVAPLKLEALLKAECPYVAQAVVHGEGRSYCSALVAIDQEAFAKWGQASSAASKEGELWRHEPLAELVKDAIERVNAGVATHEAIRKFSLMPAVPSVENGMLTASMKLRRRAVEQHYRGLLDALYGGEIGQSAGSSARAPEWIVGP